MKQAALYIRVSTEEQAVHGLSVEAQTEALDAWAKNNKVNVVDHYIDAGISARKVATKRPALQRLLDDVRAGKVELIVFTKLDRWFRNIAEYYKVEEILEHYHVDWKTIHEDYDTSTASGRLKINIMLSVAQDEADRTSERIKAVFQSKKERNEPVTGHVPTGYIIQNKHIVKDPETEEAVSAFFAHYMACGSITKAIDYVAEVHGLSLKYQTASKILARTAYCGDFNGITCPAYITPEQHETIVLNRRRIARKTIKNRVYLFSGKLVCAECGARMGARTHVYKNTENVEYNCPGHYQKKGCGNRTNIRETDIETYLITHVEQAFHTLEVRYREQITEQKRDLTSEIAAIKRKLFRLKDLYINELIDLPAYKADYTQLNAALEELSKQQKKDLSASIAAVRELLQDDWEEAYKNMTREQKREFWRQLVYEIRIYSDRHIEFNLLKDLTT